MRPVLQNMLAAVNGGAETAFIIKKETLRELLLELKDMCNPDGQFVPDETPVICRPNRAGAGFTLSTPEATFTVGTVNTGTPSVSITGTPPDYVFNFTFPPTGASLEDYPGCPATDDGVQYALQFTGGILQWTPIVP